MTHALHGAARRGAALALALTLRFGFHSDFVTVNACLHLSAARATAREAAESCHANRAAVSRDVIRCGARRERSAALIGREHRPQCGSAGGHRRSVAAGRGLRLGSGTLVPPALWSALVNSLADECNVRSLTETCTRARVSTACIAPYGVGTD
jgi:hypothetical protein